MRFAMPPDAGTLAREIEDFIASSREAIVMENGEVLFDFATAKYSLSTAHAKCVLQLWSPERNIVRRVVDAERKGEVLRLSVIRFGQAKPSRMDICQGRDRRTPAAKKAARAAYQHLLGRMLERSFPGFTVDRLSSAMDLERSFGPVYSRGMLRKGGTAFAVVGVNAQETQPSIDAALTFAILWLDHGRQGAAGHCYVEGLRLFVPAGRSAIVRERMAHLDRAAAKWELYELEETEPELTPIDTADRGNIETHLVHCPDLKTAHERFAGSIARVRRLAPEADVAVVSPGEVSFRLHGLEFARARMAPQAGSFRLAEEVIFGAGPAETVLAADHETRFADFVLRLRSVRNSGGRHDEPLWRMQPERWLESLVMRDVRVIDGRLGEHAYSQVPAFSASDRAMIDVLTVTREGRLAVLELKADEDIHLPLQGLDYWARVVWHHQRGEFQSYGYFPGEKLGPDPPLLFLVAPALRIHPATDTLLRYLAPEINCELVAVDERWREELRVIFRKRPQRAAATRI